MSLSGAIDNPLTLTEALQSPLIKPGHTIYLRGGVYSGDFISELRGATDAPITIRPYEDEKAIIDGAMTINGPHTTWQDIEFRYTGWSSRVSAYAGGSPPDIDQKWLNIFGPRTKILNCIIHDLAGVGWWRDSIDSEISGCHIYNNGWQGTDRGHGPAIYAQNKADGEKLVRDNIICPSYSYTGFEFYGTSAAPLERFRIENNVLIGTRFILGGGSPANDAVITNNLLWKSAMQVGRNNDVNGSAEIRDNYIGLAYMVPHTLTELQMTGNTVVNKDGIELMNLTMPAEPYDYTIDGNTYLSNRSVVFWNGGSVMDFSGWQASGFDSGGSFGPLPTEPAIFVRPGYVAIFNWGNAPSIPAPIAGTYTNALNVAESIVSEAGAPLPMAGWTVATPIGATAPLTTWSSQFVTFLVELS